jgi:hypothetical protein
MTLRLPRVWPPCTYLTAVLTLHTAIVCVTLLLSPGRESTDAMFAAMSPGILGLAAVCLGVYRVVGFHPALQPSYKTWLARTPWTPAKALPLGPVHLVAADVALLGAAFAADWPFYGLARSLVLLKLFIGAYSATLLLSLLGTAEWFAAYGVWLGLGAMVLFRTADGLFFATAVLTYGVGILGFRRSLARFPWGPDLSDAPAHLKTSFGWEAQCRTFLGWPFALLAPVDRFGSLSRMHGTILALLGGWAAYVLVSLFPPSDRDVVHMLAVPPIVLAALCRLAIYRFTEHRPPISLAGRIQTRRWIIPEYDRAHAAPLLATLLAASTPMVQVCGPLPASLVVPASFTASLLILLLAGPDRRTWLLTAPCRVAPVAGNRNGQWV